MLGTDMMQPHKTRFPKVSSSSVKFRGPSITCADDQASALAGVISGSVAAAGAASAAGAGAAGEATSPPPEGGLLPSFGNSLEDILWFDIAFDCHLLLLNVYVEGLNS
jgi:hypothetical protein